MTDKFTEFQKAYDSYPSQDQEGYVPDRGGFKTGFFAGWDAMEEKYGSAFEYLNDRIDKLNVRIGLALVVLGVIAGKLFWP